MKKKIVLLSILIVSLFIYTRNVDAIVMYMECDIDESDYIPSLNDSSDSDKAGKKLNGIAVINSFDDSSNSIRHVVFDRSINFYNNSNSPTFIVNRGGVDSTYESAMCWYKENSATDSDEMVNKCKKELSANPFVSKYELDKGFCPVMFYDSDADSGVTTGDFVYLAGTKAAGKKAELTEPNLAFYHYEGNAYENFFSDHLIHISGWIMEGYSSTGVYAFAFFSPISHVSTLSSLFPFIIGSHDNNDIMDSNGDFDTEYVSQTQAVLIKRISRLGDEYFQLDLAKEKPGVLTPCYYTSKDLTDSGQCTGNSGIKIGNIHVYGQNTNTEIWSEVDEWYDSSISEILNRTGNNYLKFPNPELDSSEVQDIDNTYYNLIIEAEKFNNKVEAGKKIDLNKINFDETFLKLDNALSDLKNLQNSDGFPHYKKNESGKCVAINTGKPYADPHASLRDYIICSTVGEENFSLVGGTANRNYLINDIFLDILSSQISKKFGVGFNLFDIRDIKERYAISLGKFASYLGYYYSSELNSNQKKTIDSIIKKYKDYIRSEYHAEIVVSCDDLLGEDFLNRISKYVDIIKIAVPIILIGFGILDFTKALFAGDEEKMRSAQKKFLMRIIVAILFFLLPFVLKIILTIANKAWSFISPGGCSIK